MDAANDKRWKDRPGIWFGLLLQALREGNQEKAGEAQANLERLGVEVRFRLPPQIQEASAS